MNQHQFREHLVECVDLLARMLKDFDTDPEFLSKPNTAEMLHDISGRVDFLSVELKANSIRD